jgi:hypothetical protein
MAPHRNTPSEDPRTRAGVLRTLGRYDLIGEGVVSACDSFKEKHLWAAKDTAVNLPELLRRQSVQHFQFHHRKYAPEKAEP